MQRASTLSLLAAALALVPVRAAHAADLMPPAEETDVVHKYCGGCHSDRLMYGGLSIEHFDASHADPAVAAILLAKLTHGRTPKVVAAAEPAAILKMMGGSAMGAAGMGVPDEPTQVALARALAQQGQAASEWNVAWDAAGGPDRNVTASIVKDKPSVRIEGAADLYRVIVTCRAASNEGEIKIAWADNAPTEGQMMSVAVDGAAPFEHKLEGGRAQGNGNYGPGATILKIPLPSRSLTISSLFSPGSIEFPFADLNPSARRDLAACFPNNESSVR